MPSISDVKLMANQKYSKIIFYKADLQVVGLLTTPSIQRVVRKWGKERLKCFCVCKQYPAQFI